MRLPALPLLVLALAAAGGAWVVFGASGPTPEETSSGLPPEPRPSGAQPPADAPAVEVPRIGVVRGGEAFLPPRGDERPWQERQVRLGRDARGRVTGAVLLEALSEQFYVRAPSLSVLDEVRAHPLEVEPDATLPVPVVVAMLESLGYRVAVRESVVMIAPRPPSPASPPGEGQDPSPEDAR